MLHRYVYILHLVVGSKYVAFGGKKKAATSVTAHPKALGVTVDDLVNSLHSSKKRKSLKAQLSQFHGKTLKPPEHRAESERNKRKTAYESTKKETNKWNTVVDRIQKARVVDFTDAVRRPKECRTVNELVNWFQPKGELEEQIDRVVQQSLVENQWMEEYEKTKKSSKDDEQDAEALRSYKAKMRALMSYFEQKQRRIKKIKSKRYRKARRSKQNKANAKVQSLKDTRIEERMSLRHKNTSNWVKRQLQRNAATKDESAKLAIQEQLEIGRERVDRKSWNETKQEASEDDSRSSSSSEEEEKEEDTSNQHWDTEMEQDDVKALEASIQQTETPPQGSTEECKNITWNTTSQVFKNLSNITKETRNFTTPSRISVDMNNPQISDSITITCTKNTPTSPSEMTTSSSVVSNDNPWLMGGKTSQRTRKRNKQPVPVHPQSDEKHTTTEESLSTATNGTNIHQDSVDKDVGRQDESDNDDSLSTSSEEDSDSNKYYLKRAFVETDIEDNDFEKEKQQQVDEELEWEQPEQDGILPGWGTWGGAGILPHKSRYAEKVKLENEKKKEAAKAKRKDSKRGMEHVIISEKRVKQTAALTVPFVPAPLKSRQEYEAITKMPLGKEWLRFESYQKAIQPSIISPIGSNIETIHPKRISGTQEQIRL